MAKRVLVVAGREGVAPALQVQIELWGDLLDFSLAASGNEALWEVRGSPYDLVLAPWQLPEMTGIEFAEVVQALSPATRVVLIGVKVTPALRNRAKTLGVYALLSETSPQEVAVLISRALDTALPRPRPVPVPEPELAEISTEVTPASKPAEVAPPEPADLTVVLTKVEVDLTPEQREGVRRALRDLVVSIGPQIALLVSTGAEILVAEGSPGDLDLESLATHVVIGLSGVDDLAELLEDEPQLGLSLVSGSKYDIYSFTVTDLTILLFVFDKAVGEVKLGSVWLYTRRVVDDLREVLS